jgi:hypothetical protein
LSRLLSLAGFLLAACTVQIEERVRLCDARAACAEQRQCVDGYCVDADQRVDTDVGPCDDASVWALPNLITNGTFEQSTYGWNSSNATLERTETAFFGDFALRVRGEQNTSSIVLNDSPGWMEDSPGPGRRYCYTAWVRSDASTSEIYLRLKEYDTGGSTLQQLDSTPTGLSPSWQRLRRELVTVGEVGSTFDVQVEVDSPNGPGEHFDVDGAALRLVPP